jgi:hypothetical protein
MVIRADRGRAGGPSARRAVMAVAAVTCAGLLAGLGATGPAASSASRENGAAGGWDTAIEVPGTAGLNTGGDATVESVSCAAAGSCTAGGLYADGSGHGQAFVVTEAGGRWRTAIKVPGKAALNKGGEDVLNSVSCAAAGSCAAGGDYRDRHRHHQAFVVTKP